MAKREKPKMMRAVFIYPAVSVLAQRRGESTILKSGWLLCEVENSLRSFQAAVGGNIELVSFRNEVGDELASAYCNEDGLSMGLLSNMLATEVCDSFIPGFKTHNRIVGPLLIIGPVDDEGEHTIQLSDRIVHCVDTTRQPDKW